MPDLLSVDPKKRESALFLAGKHVRARATSATRTISSASRGCHRARGHRLSGKSQGVVVRPVSAPAVAIAAAPAKPRRPLRSLTPTVANRHGHTTRSPAEGRGKGLDEKSGAVNTGAATIAWVATASGLLTPEEKEFCPLLLTIITPAPSGAVKNRLIHGSVGGEAHVKGVLSLSEKIEDAARRQRKQPDTTFTARPKSSQRTVRHTSTANAAAIRLVKRENWTFVGMPVAITSSEVPGDKFLTPRFPG